MSESLQGLLALSAERFPERTAFVCGDASINYLELDQATNRFGRLLHGAGIGPGDRVGIHLDKSIEAVVAFYGVLKSGAAYVPLDPFAPAARNRVIIADCELAALVGSGQALRQLPVEDCEALLIDVSEDINQSSPGRGRLLDRRDLEQTSDAALQNTGTDPDSLAYILYTSGSTGTPKGVMVSHRAARAFVDWAGDAFALTEHDLLAALAPFIFDISVFDLYAGVRAGATTFLVPRSVIAFPMSLAGFLESKKITVLYTVPSSLTRLAEQGGLEKRKFENLRAVLFAGEVFPMKHLRQLMQQIPGAKYYNLYGPTETNVVTCYSLQNLPAPDAPPVPIGFACAGAELMLVNEQGDPVAAGESGELLTSGPTLMQGYWNRPQQTETVMYEHPRNGKYYRTGDLARRGARGELIFLGRRDNMIKSRGYRIEPGDIEAVLDTHPGINRAVVIAIPDEEIGSRLCAVFEPADNQDSTEPDNGVLTGYCRERLPAYMIPTEFQRRASLPQTLTGKIDRVALINQTTTAGGAS